MKRHFYLLSLSFLFPFVLASQTLPYASIYDDWRTGEGNQSVFGQANFLLGSNSLQNSFISNYYFGGFIEDEKIETAAGKLLTNNAAGLDFNFQAGYLNKKDTAEGNGFHYGLSVGYLQHNSVSFPDDFFRLVFQGNSRFKGESVILSETEYSEYAYSMVKLHGVKQFSGTHSNLVAGGAVGLMVGNFYKDLDIPSGSLFTSSNADSIQLALQMEYEFTGSAAEFNWRGTGAAADVFASWEKRSSTISIFAEGLGFITWNDQTERLSIDTSIHFTGVDVSDLIAGEAATDLETSLDSLQEKLGVTSKGESTTEMLPFRLKLNFRRKIENWKSELNVGGFYQYTQGFFPMLYINFEKELKPWLRMQTGYSYGSYGMGGVALGARADIGKRFMLSASTWHLDGLLLPKNFRGQSLTVRSCFLF